MTNPLVDPTHECLGHAFVDSIRTKFGQRILDAIESNIVVTITVMDYDL